VRLFIFGGRSGRKEWWWFFIVALVLRGMRDTTKCTEPYIVYLMAPETHSTYCPSISERTGRQELILRRQENGLALDNSSYTFDYVAAGSSHLIHVGWLHPHPARLGDHRRIDPHYPRAQTGLTFRAILAIVRGKHSLNSITAICGYNAHPVISNMGAHLFVF
jgi:hypothetical protein